MKFLLMMILGVGVLLGLSGSAFAQADEKVKVKVVTDGARFAKAGDQLRVGFLLTIRKTFHIYWTNPGDSGGPTEIKLKLPHNISADPIRFPAPMRIEIPGGMVNFGYENKVMFVTTLRANSDLDPKAELRADLEWLVCDENSCVPGEAKDLLIPTNGSNADAKAITDWMLKLPVAAEKGDGVKAVSKSDGAVEIEWLATPTRIEAFPPDERWTIEKPVTKDNKTTVKLKYNAKAGQAENNSPGLPILAYTLADGSRRAIELTNNVSK